MNEMMQILIYFYKRVDRWLKPYLNKGKLSNVDSHPWFNSISPSCSFSGFLLEIPQTQISPDVGAIYIAEIVANALACPVIIVLNILVMVVVKTKPQLWSKSNRALAVLFTTDFEVTWASC